MEPVHHTLSNTTKKKSLGRIFYNSITQLGEDGTFNTVAFLWVFTYLGYYTTTDLSLGDMIASPKSNKIYLYIAFIFYIFHMIYILTLVNKEKICKKYNVAVIE